MRKQPYPIAQLTGGLDVSVDPVFLLDKASPNVENIRIDKALIKKGLGLKAFSTDLPLDSAVMLIDSFPQSDGTTDYIFVTLDYVYSYSSLTDTFTNISQQTSPPTPDAFTGDLDNQFCGCTAIKSDGSDVYILTNGVDVPQMWDGSDEFEDLTGWTTVKAKNFVYWKNRLIAAGTIESGTACPKRIRWSVAGDITDISGTGSGFFDLVETADFNVAFLVMKDKLYVIKERSIWELEYVGGTTVFNPVLKVSAVGSYTPHGAVPLDEEMIFYGTDNVYLFDGFSLNPVGTQIYPKLYETDSRIVNASVATRFQAAYVEELQQYLLCVASGENTVPNLVFAYDFNNGAWTVKQQEVTAIGYFDVGSSLQWNELTTTWANWVGVWRSASLPDAAPTTLFGDTDGNVWEDDRLTTSTQYMCYETKDFIFEHAVRWVEFRVQARYGPFSVKYSIDGGENWSSEKSFSVSTDWTEYAWFLNLTSAKIRFRIECDASQLEIKWLEPWYIERKRSKVLVTS